ncbi:MAG: DUF3333 domain-containing protein, partial [Pseudomonadales bacterium]
MSNSHSPSTIEIVNRNLAVRYARERRFRRLGLAAVLSGFAALIFLMVTIVGDGWRAFQQAVELRGGGGDHGMIFARSRLQRRRYVRPAFQHHQRAAGQALDFQAGYG